MRPQLTSAQRAFLRSRARRLRAEASVGKAGLAENVLSHLRVLLERRELVKVRLSGPAAEDRRATAEGLAEALDADLVDLIGRVVVLYRPGEDLPPAKRLHLPGP